MKTNIITGFLGVGKTTLIQHLLNNKPEHERWAVLVNEFGEIGIDGAFFNGKPENGIYVREIPGGCMCCTSGLPMQIGLNQLIHVAKPHRLLIEPTGLGHPKEVIATLKSPHYNGVIDMRATLSLVDARNLRKEKYRDHPTFQEQLQIADQIVATKTDLYNSEDLNYLSDYLHDLGVAETPVIHVSGGTIDSALLEPACTLTKTAHTHHHHHEQSSTADIEKMLAEKGVASIANQGERFFSHGWAFSAEHIFEFRHIMDSLIAIRAERLKAVFITEKGIFAFNLAEGALQCTELDEAFDSRLEFIVDNAESAKAIKHRLESTLFVDRL